MSKGKILKFNKYMLPIGVCDWREGIKNIFSQAAFPLDVHYSEDQDGSSLEEWEWCRAIPTWAEWCELPVRPYDEGIRTSKGLVRAPSMIMCAHYNKVIWHKVLFPTKQNIWARDKNICAYTGRKLNNDERSVDHIIPRSKGGQDTWLNLVTCDKKVNSQKGDLNPEDFHMKLRYKPFVPKNTVSFPVLRPEWQKLIAEAT